jgi:hypothetical protein
MVDVPANENAACNPGWMAADNNGVYTCYSQNKWVRTKTDSTWGSGGAPPPSGEISFTQTAGGSMCDLTDNCTVTFPSAVATGNLIVVWVTATGATVTDTLGNSYSVAAEGALNDDHIYYTVSGSSGSNSVRVTATDASGYPSIIALEYHGAHSSPFDVSAIDNTGKHGIASANGNYTDNVTTSVADDLCVAFFMNWEGSWASVPTAGTNYTYRESVTAALGTVWATIAEDWTNVGVAGVKDAHSTPPSTSDYGSAIACFKKQ